MSKLKKKECLYYLEKNRFGILAVCLNNEPFTYLIKYDLDYFNGYVTLSFKLKKNSKLISILKSNNRSLQARQRLKIMETSNSGFDIAQKDLELRGPGDFFGIRQSGLPEFKLANLLTDVNVLKETQEAVKDLLKEDRNLSKHITLKKELFDKYGEQLTKRTT